MAKNITRHVQHIKSVDTTTITVDGQDVIVAKLPEWGDLKDGEIAVNYKDGYETISIRNNNNEVVAFPNINTVNTLIDEKAQAALTFDSTPTANSTNPVTSGGIKTALDEKQDKMLIVTATITGGDGTTYYNATLDKTHSEIVAAMQANKNVYIYVPSMFGGAYIQMTQITGTNTNAFFVIIADELWYCHTSMDDDDNSCTIYKFNYLTEGDADNFITSVWYDITNKIVKKQDYDGNVSNVLTFDTTPTANSVNPVTSDGIKTYVDNGDKIQTLTTYQSSTPLAVGDTHDQALSKLSKIIDDNEIVTARALTDLNDTKQDEIEDLDVIRTGAALGATALQTETQLSKGTTTGSGNAVTDISVDNHQITLTKGATFLTEHQDLSAYADGAEYDSAEHLIYLKHGNTRLANPINAADFIKDGMVNSVRIDVLDDGSDSSDSPYDETRYLIVTFNTDAGLEDIEIPLTDIFDPSLYYTKEEINEHELVTAAALTELHDTKADKVALNDLNTNKQDKLEFDDEPTEDSSNPVTSNGIKTYVDNANKITTLEEPTVSTPLAVGDTYDTAFGKLTKIIRDNEFTTAGALTELHETKLEAGDVYSKQEVDTMTQDKYATLLVEGFSDITEDSQLVVSDVLLSDNCEDFRDANYIRVVDLVSSPISQVTQTDRSALFYLVDTISRQRSIMNPVVGNTHLFSRTIKNTAGETIIETITYHNNDNNSTTSSIENAEWYYHREIVSKLMNEVTYSELKNLRDNSQLTPGALYRITDYQCTTTQENTKSAGHQFDIVLLALSENKLAEEGWAMMHETPVFKVTFSNSVIEECYLRYLEDNGGIYILVSKSRLLGYDFAKSEFESISTIDWENKLITVPFEDSVLSQDIEYNYFQNSNLSAWKVWYCLDNDTSRFAWADAREYIICGIGDGDFKWFRSPQQDYDGFYAWDRGDAFVWTDTETPQIGSYTYDDTGTRMGNDFTNVKKVGADGRGVIYRLIDEFNNDIKYDFKNIQFKRTITDGQYDEQGTETWCYTLNVWHNNMCQDASIVGNTLPNDEGYVTGVYDNNFGYATAYDLYIEVVNTFAFELGDNVILSFDDNDGYYYGIYSNTIGNSFYNNTIGSSFCDNTIGNYLTSNTIGNNFRSNTIGNSFASNTIGNYSGSNTIGNNFASNTIGNNFGSNTIGNNFGSNTIGNNFSSNTIGNYSGSNTIGNEFRYNTIGNNFQDNTIGNNFSSNTIGNDFGNNTIGTGTGSTATTIDYVRYIRVEDGVQYVNITTSATTSSSAYLQNITISQGIAGSSNSNKKTISHPTVGDTFKTTYQPANSDVVSV